MSAARYAGSRTPAGQATTGSSRIARPVKTKTQNQVDAVDSFLVLLFGA
jgi:hypothetical protein